MKSTAPKKQSFHLSSTAQWIILTTMLGGLPLAGVWLSGRQLQPYLEFPPLTRYIQHAQFSKIAFGLFAFIDFLLLLFLLHLFIKAYGQRPLHPRRLGRFPLWGWSGLLIMSGGWLLAWTRFAWFASLQHHTFCLPWIGYIVLINAICTWRSGRSLLTDAGKKFPLLILGSSLFWWYFEYLNRFVQNWYYTGVDDLNPLSYTAFASLAFATVLPAVLSTYRLLLTFSIFNPGLSGIRPIDIRYPKRLTWSVLFTASAGLLFIGVWPDLLFPLLWVAPLLIISALRYLSGREKLFIRLKNGDWRSIITSALAALICGFFWELWNIGSLARWHYNIPYVDRYHLFAMPLLGYGGYLPFGLECLLVGGMVIGDQHLDKWH